MNMLRSDASGEEGNPFGTASHSEVVKTDLAPPILLQYWQILLRWKWIVIGIVVSAFALGFLVTLLTTPQYMATSRIQIAREAQNITKVEGLEPRDARGDQEFYQTQYSLLAARSLAERVARELQLGRSAEFFQAHGADLETDGLLKTGGGVSAADRARGERAAVDLLLSNIKISPISRSRLVDVSYTSASPELSAKIVNAWTRQFIQSNIDRRFASTADARKFLESRLSELQTRLENSERAVVSFAAEKGIVALTSSKDGEGKTAVERTLASSDLEALNAALSQATAERITAESRAGRGGGTVGEALTNGTLIGLRQRRAEASAEYAKMMVQFEPSYPAAQALREQISALDSSIQREESRIRNVRGSEYGETVKREQTLRARVEEIKGRLGQQQRDSIQYNILQREADTTRQLYDSLLQRYKEIGVAGVESNNVSIVDPARVPERPSSPRLIINLLLALAAGLGVALVTVLGLEQIDEGLRQPGDVARLLHVSLLGSVPDTDNQQPLDLIKDPKSALSEAYLSIRSNLAFSSDHGVPRAMMVTSSRAGEGKSTTTLSISSVLRRTGARVLVIDADMRSPTVHFALGGGNERGLSNFLAGEDDWRGLSQVSSDGVSYISAGPQPPNAAELLSGERMVLLVQQILKSGDFDHVLIDSPPVLGLADAPLLTRAVEGVVYVVEVGGVAVRGVQSALGRLQQVHARIYGVVLTKLAQSHAGYGYGYGYSYGYSSSEKRED
ncbi:GumC family protein [Sphingomonas koreensis]|uniref:GumC family protein n=1 Tax=Sphingomonas koreensis TaxID=93064 RepID=UPI001F49E323|nr:polysaccharide biosynthesis tyrosine autokinase [Sphingomonas koreensis]